jgi:hypothetical protein
MMAPIPVIGGWRPVRNIGLADRATCTVSSFWCTVTTIMLDKKPVENQVSPPVTPALQVRTHPKPEGTGFGPHGGARPGAGRPKGSLNKIPKTFRDLLMQAAQEVGDSQEVGKDGEGGILSYLKVSAIQERRMFTLLLGRILPQKITTEVKQLKEKMTIHEAVADLKACGLDPLLAFYLQRYPIGRDEADPSWAEGIDTSLAFDLPIDVTPPKDDTGSDTGNGTT